MGHIQTLIRKIMHATKWVTIVSDGRSIKEKLKKFCSGPVSGLYKEGEKPLRIALVTLPRHPIRKIGLPGGEGRLLVAPLHTCDSVPRR
jgi:hypothetical protein